jgi:hypothetical protein
MPWSELAISAACARRAGSDPCPSSSHHNSSDRLRERFEEDRTGLDGGDCKIAALPSSLWLLNTVEWQEASRRRRASPNMAVGCSCTDKDPSEWTE